MIILPAIQILWTNTYLGYVFLLVLSFAGLFRFIRF